VNKSFFKFVTDFGPLLIFFSFYYKNDKINITDGYPLDKTHNENPGTHQTTSKLLVVKILFSK